MEVFARSLNDLPGEERACETYNACAMVIHAARPIDNQRSICR
jgi:hypothetical protein